MTTFESKGFRRLGHMPAVPIELGQYRLPLKCKYPLGERSGGIGFGDPRLGGSGF